MATPCSVLLLTVGTGTRDKTVETILDPFRKSLEAAGAERNILLPSQITEPIARKIAENFPQFRAEILPLAKAGDENNADRCFEHYDAVIAELLAQGADPAAMIADITRGTKAMSAALLLAAAVRGVKRVRYLASEQRNESGMAEPGSEQVSDIEPSFIFIRQTLLRAEELLRAGNFRAAEQLLAPLWPGEGHPKESYEKEAAALMWATRFWGAWDRFDYAAAEGLLGNIPSPPAAAFNRYHPSAEQKKLLAALGSRLPKPMGERVRHCRALTADLLANAERRFAEGHSEEALVRVYRILEMVSLYRLFSHGIDAENVDWNHERVKQWLAARAESGSRGSRPTRALGRKHAAELLVFLEQRGRPGSRGAVIAEKLAKTGAWLGANDAELRNGSILIHGLTSSSVRIRDRVVKILEKVREFYYEEHPGNEALHKAAKFVFMRPPAVTSGG